MAISSNIIFNFYQTMSTIIIFQLVFLSSSFHFFFYLNYSHSMAISSNIIFNFYQTMSTIIIFQLVFLSFSFHFFFHQNYPDHK